MGRVRLPHFLRVTQALAFVSGAGAPAAAMLATVDCGGSSFSQGAGDGAPEDGSSSGNDVGAVVGVGIPYDGSPVGVSPLPAGDGSMDASRDATKDATGDGAIADALPAPIDVVVRDVVTGIQIAPDAAYDGRPMGVIVMLDASRETGFPGIQIPPDGGPMSPPELPA